MIRIPPEGDFAQQPLELVCNRDRRCGIEPFPHTVHHRTYPGKGLACSIGIHLGHLLLYCVVSRIVKVFLRKLARVAPFRHGAPVDAHFQAMLDIEGQAQDEIPKLSVDSRQLH